MKRFKVVQSEAWRRSIVSLMFESHDEETALQQAYLLGDALKEAYQVVDAWDPANQFPISKRALLQTPAEVATWLAKHRAATTAPK